MKSSINPLALAIACAASSASAQLHQGDVLLELNEENQIVTGVIDDDTGDIVRGVRVFQATFGEAVANFTNEPGFDSENIFPSRSRIGFTIRRALRVWSSGAFDTIPTERIEVRLGALGPTVTPLNDTAVTGFSMPVDTDGIFHQHPGYTLLSPASEGIYLYEFELWSNSSLVQSSRPLWFVFNQNRPAKEHDEAAQWVRDNLECRADFDGDGFVTGLDYDSFVFAFEGGESSADFDQDGFITGLDFDQYVFAFERGCNA